MRRGKRRDLLVCEPIIDRDRALAKDLGSTGSPAFIVGAELYPGAMDLTVLKDLVAQARAPKAVP